ncbi:hypothetical protein C8R44DRAFT_191632 [Mycena epipterygia]|nr:hypothetical protein C8R44DRAFT_191632 [Mycena epipterygia]
MVSESTAFAVAASLAEPAYDSKINVAATTLARHQELLASNIPADSAELPFIRSNISQTGAHLAHLDDEISRLRDRLKELEEERASLACYHAQNSAILSPLRRMPSEMLSEIFSWTLPSIGDATNRVRPEGERSPWVLTHISNCWRAVALSTPLLWSLFAFDYASTPHHSLSLSMVKTQIQRARTLKIHFYGDQNMDPRPQVQMFQLLAEHSSRWEDLCVELTSGLVPILATVRDRLPLLHRLWIQWDGLASQAAVDSIDCFLRASSLVEAGTYNQYRAVHFSSLRTS